MSPAVPIRLAGCVWAGELLAGVSLPRSVQMSQSSDSISASNRQTPSKCENSSKRSTFTISRNVRRREDHPVSKSLNGYRKHP